MRIVVCAKHVPDSTEIRYDEATNKPVLSSAPTKISDYERNALELAVTLKEAAAREAAAPVQVDVIMTGGAEAQKGLKEALAMGADTGFLLEGGWEDPHVPLRAATVLAGAVRAVGVPDLILTGLVSEDGYNGLTGAALAELLDVPYLAPAIAAVAAGDGAIEVTLDLDTIRRVVRAATPVVLGIDSSANVPRLPTVLQVMKVKSDRVRHLSLTEAGAPPDIGRAGGVGLAGYESGAVKRKAVVLQGPPAETVPALIQALRQEGVLA